MNIFVTSNSPYICATVLDDKRVARMAHESAQMLAMPFRIHKGEKRIGHKNHPCSVWARETKENFSWLLYHMQHLCYESCYRKAKEHVEDMSLTEFFDSLEKLSKIKVKGYKTYVIEAAFKYKKLKEDIVYVPDGELTPFVNCSLYQHPDQPFDVHKAYRLTMLHKWYVTDVRSTKWTNRPVPWFVTKVR